MSKAQSTVPMVRIREVFTLLADECGFLLEDKVREQCLGCSDQQQLTYKIDSIRKTLGIETMEDIQLLVNIFYDRSGRERDELYQSEDEEPEGDDLRVDPDLVIDLLMQF